MNKRKHKRIRYRRYKKSISTIPDKKLRIFKNEIDEIKKWLRSGDHKVSFESSNVSISGIRNMYNIRKNV